MPGVLAAYDKIQRVWARCGGTESPQPQPCLLICGVPKTAPGALVIKSELGRRHSGVGRRPEGLNAVRVCVLTCLLENTMITPVKFKSRVWAVWVEEADTGSAQAEREYVNKDRGPI